ncbi:LamG domain-containing protein [Patescibacteria group bacterium]|nr:LamG domain-containing protein [Patescibacteria group bacterium]MCL5114283.1 LamG domain-containing protein [Patescibacteria group bacterium]
MRRNEGQSLIEVLIGLAIGALIIGAASIAIAFVLRAGSTTQTLTTATELSQDLMSKVKSFALSNWNGVYNLQHGSTSTYFLVSSSSGFMAVPGEEGIIDGEIQNGLVGRWGFDEGTGTVTYDESGDGHNGTFVNGPVWQATSTCKESYCLGFNGSSTYVVNNNGGFLPSGGSARTIAFWGYPLPSGSYPIVIAYGCSSEGYGCSDSGQGKYVAVEVGASWGFRVDAETCGIVGPSVPAPQQAWHFFTVVFNGDNTVTFYIDGMNKSTVTAPCTINTVNGNGFSIGAGRWGYYSGLLDDVRVYNRALSANEIDQLYNSSVFRRYFYVDNACRSISSTSTSPLASSTTCSAGYYSDPSTQKVTAVTEWDAAGKTSNFSLSDFVTRWTNFVFDQSDWSGGLNPNGVFGVPSNQFASSVNVTATGTPFGAIQIQNLSQQ